MSRHTKFCSYSDHYTNKENFDFNEDTGRLASYCRTCTEAAKAGRRAAFPYKGLLAGIMDEKFQYVLRGL